jgi:hypothetical protein
MSIQNLYPNIAPSLSLDFASVQALDPRITFTRASTATYYGTQTAKAEENLLLQSQDFTTTWTNTRSTDSANTTAAPDGTTTADSVLQQAGQTTSGAVQQTITSVVGDYAVSIFAKPNGKNFLVIREVLLDGTSNDTWFDVQNGTVGTTDAGHTATITASTNSYYRCSIKFTANAARVGNIVFFIADTNGSLTVADDGNGLYFWGAQVEQRSAVTAYTPTTTQPITNYIPVLQTAAAGVARFDHNPTTFESLGLLIEEQRTNLLLRSEEFDDSYWSKNRSSITANTIVAPDGTLTGDKLVEDTSASTDHLLTRNITGTAVVHAASIYAKASERTEFRLRLFNGTTYVTSVYFDLSAGTAGSGGTITPIGNGWYKCSITGTLTTSSSCNFRVALAVNGSDNYTGDGYSGIYIWGAQLEAGAFPTSYIPTVASQVTRSADAASMTGANFSSWYRADEGTLYAETTLNARLGDTLAGGLGLGANQMFFSPTGTTSARFRVRNNSVDQALITSTIVNIAGGSAKQCAAYKTDDFAFSANGNVAGTDTSGTVPIVDRLNIGFENLNNVYCNTTIRKLAFYPKRIANAELQALTQN